MILQTDLKERLTHCKINLLVSERPAACSCEHGNENQVRHNSETSPSVDEINLVTQNLVLRGEDYLRDNGHSNSPQRSYVMHFMELNA
jgi:hypothetical protein